MNMRRFIVLLLGVLSVCSACVAQMRTDAEMDMLGKHIVYKEVKQGMYQSYCYDPERL